MSLSKSSRFCDILVNVVDLKSEKYLNIKLNKLLSRYRILLNIFKMLITLLILHVCTIVLLSYILHTLFVMRTKFFSIALQHWINITVKILNHFKFKHFDDIWIQWKKLFLACTKYALVQLYVLYVLKTTQTLLIFKVRCSFLYCLIITHLYYTNNWTFVDNFVYVGDIIKYVVNTNRIITSCLYYII